MKYVTARELAEELLKNPDDIVCSVSDNFEQGNAVLPKKYVSLHRYKGKVEPRRFRDAFDGENYSSDVVLQKSVHDSYDGGFNFVQI